MNLAFRLNLDTEDIEMVLNDEVIDTIGADIVANWVEAINEKNKPVEEEAAEVVEETPEEEAEVVEETAEAKEEE